MSGPSPDWSKSLDLLREKVCRTGSAILDCPLQYHTSPNVTSKMAASPVQPLLHLAAIEKLPPGGLGLRKAFHVALAPVAPGVTEASTV